MKADLIMRFGKTMRPDGTTMYAFNNEGEAEAAEIAQAATAEALARAAPSKRPRPASDGGRQRREHEIDLTVRWDFYGHILADHALTPGAIRVAFALLNRYNHDTGECFPGIETLMSDTGLGRTAVIDGLRGADKGRQNGLISRGWFTARKRRNLSNRYSPNLAKVGLTGREGERLAVFDKLDVRKSELSDGSGQPEIRTPDVRKSELGTAVNPNCNPFKGTQSKRTHVEKTAAPFSNGSPVSHTDFVGGAPTTGSFEPKPVQPCRAWVEPEQLDAWWELFRDAYPHEPGLAKAKGMFCKVILEGKATIDELLTAVDRYTDNVNPTGMAFANATRWLCDERWTDEYDSPPVNAAKAPDRSKAPASPNPAPVAPEAAVSTHPERKGITIGPDWRPSPRAWDLVLADEGEEATEEALAGFNASFVGHRLPNPDAQWAAHCREWFAPF